MSKKAGLFGLACAGALTVALAPSAAFADLELSLGPAVDVDYSWFLPVTVVVKAGPVQSTPFNNIKLFAGGAGSFATNVTLNVANQKFEDFTENPVVGGDDSHRSIDDFDNYKVGPLTDNGTANWTQTSPAAPGAGALLSTFVTAAGDLVTNSPSGSFNILDFNLYFNMEETDGVHFFIEFWNNTSFQGGYEVWRIQRTSETLPDTQINPYSTPIPLPPAVWSGLAVLGGMGFMIARRRRNQILA